jgi:hypothetical protein
MSITQLSEKLRIVLWCTVVGAAIGVVYAEFDVARTASRISLGIACRAAP